MRPESSQNMSRKKVAKVRDVVVGVKAVLLLCLGKLDGVKKEQQMEELLECILKRRAREQQAMLLLKSRDRSRSLGHEA